MRLVGLLLASFLIGAAPTPTPVSVGAFQTWLSSKKVPLNFVAGGVSVHVEALPCPAAPVGDSTCRWEGYNNQGSVTVSFPGVAPLTVNTNGASAYARIAIVRFDRRDPRPGVIVESQSGGSGGNMTAQLIIPSSDGFRALPLGRSDTRDVQGEIANYPSDVSGDGRIDLQLEDAAFESVFGCNACTPRPPRVFTVKNGEVVDRSGDPSLRAVFAADMARLAPQCLSERPDRNGACAAYVADAARAGRFEEAWVAMLIHYELGATLWEPCDVPISSRTEHRCPEGHTTRFSEFPQSLRAFLKRTGYLPT